MEYERAAIEALGWGLFSDTRRAYDYYNLAAQYYLEHKDNDKAAKMYEKAGDLSPSNNKKIFELAFKYYDRALDKEKVLPKISADVSPYHLQLANVFKDEYRMDRALEYYKSYAIFDPHGWLYVGYAEMILKEGDPEERFEALIKLNEKYVYDLILYHIYKNDFISAEGVAAIRYPELSLFIFNVKTKNFEDVFKQNDKYDRVDLRDQILFRIYSRR